MDSGVANLPSPDECEYEEDKDYTPTDTDVEEYARFLGIAESEQHLMWIAREGVASKLPEGWKPCATKEGQLYYFNTNTGESSWAHPLDSYYREKVVKERLRHDRKSMEDHTQATTPSKAVVTEHALPVSNLQPQKAKVFLAGTTPPHSNLLAQVRIGDGTTFASLAGALPGAPETGWRLVDEENCLYPPADRVRSHFHYGVETITEYGHTFTTG
eukprot:Sspe_Gene.83214::Locus_54588_Transcript_1_1_Confidence_1.000_Length_740::g.83214::m.83214